MINDSRTRPTPDPNYPSEQPRVSKRVSRGLFSFFSSKGQQSSQPQYPAGKQRPGPLSASAPIVPADPIARRFDHISLTSNAQRNDPAFSRDPSKHHDHPIVVGPGVRARLEGYAAVGTELENHESYVGQIQEQLPSRPPIQQPHASAPPNAMKTQDSGYYSGSSPSMTPSTSHSGSTELNPGFSAMTSIIPSPLPRQLVVPPEIAAHRGLVDRATSSIGDSGDMGRERPQIPPPDYDSEALPVHPVMQRNESAPELHHPAETQRPPPRAQSAPPVPVPGPAPPRESVERRPGDLDRIDELDESSPLGIAMHHEGPFQAVSTVVGKVPPTVPGRISGHPPPRTQKVQNRTSLSIKPGQIMPASFFYTPISQPLTRPPPIPQVPVAGPSAFRQDPPNILQNQPVWNNQSSLSVVRSSDVLQHPVESPARRESLYSDDYADAYGGIEEVPAAIPAAIPEPRVHPNVPPPPQAQAHAPNNWGPAPSRIPPPWVQSPPSNPRQPLPATSDGSGVLGRPDPHQFQAPRPPTQFSQGPQPGRRVVSYQLPPGAAQPHSVRMPEQRIPQPPVVRPQRDPHEHYHAVFAESVRERDQQSIAPTTASGRRGPLPHHLPRALVMPAPLQQRPNPPSADYRDSPASGAGPQALTRAQTIQMDGSRHLLRKRSNVQQPMNVQIEEPFKPRYMAPPPTNAVVLDDRKKPKRLLSKRR